MLKGPLASGQLNAVVTYGKSWWWHTMWYWGVTVCHDDVIKWKHFPRYWPIVRGIHRSPSNSLHMGQRRGALMFFLICAWISNWVNNRKAGDLKRHRAHYDVIVMVAHAPYRLFSKAMDILWIIIKPAPRPDLTSRDRIARFPMQGWRHASFCNARCRVSPYPIF